MYLDMAKMAKTSLWLMEGEKKKTSLEILVKCKTHRYHWCCFNANPLLGSKHRLSKTREENTAI